MKPIKNNVTDYNKVLNYGKSNAILAKDLMLILGFDNIRALRADIAKSRQSGQIILSTPSDSGGYWLPGDDNEVREFIATYSKQAISLLKVLKSARAYLKEDADQLTFEDIMEEMSVSENE